MVKNLKIFFIILINLFSIFKFQIINENNSTMNSFQKFVKCIKEKSNTKNKSKEIVNSILDSSNKNMNISKIQNLLTDNFDKIIDCLDLSNIPKFPDGTSIIDFDKLFATRYDWVQFLACLLTKITTKLADSPLQNLIKNINEGKYYNAIREEFKLRNNGNSGVRECMTFKLKKLFNITINNTLDN